MSEKLSRKAVKVQEVIKEKGFEFSVKELPDSTRTAVEAANAVGCEVGQIAKSLVFIEKDNDIPVLVIASGINRVDIKKIENQTGRKLIQAKGKEIKKRVGFAIGGIPPVGHKVPLITILDPDLQQFETIWAAAGTPHAMFELKSVDLEPLTEGQWVELAETKP